MTSYCRWIPLHSVGKQNISWNRDGRLYSIGNVYVQFHFIPNNFRFLFNV